MTDIPYNRQKKDVKYEEGANIQTPAFKMPR